MKKFLFIICLSLITFASCKENDEPNNDPSGSPRDWTYYADKGKAAVYINGVEQTSVSEISVSSKPLQGEYIDGVYHPLYDMTLKVVGLPKKGKTAIIKVVSGLEEFEGETEIQDIKYKVTGRFDGDPLDHWTKNSITVYLSQL